MFGLNKKDDAAKVTMESLQALFGESANAEGFDLKAEVQSLIDLRAGVEKLASIFGDSAKAEGFDLHAAVKNLQSTNASMTAAFGEAANAEGFDAVASIKAGIAAQSTVKAITEVYGDDAKAEGFDVVAAAKADRNAIKETDGAERTNAVQDPPEATDKVAKEFRCETDALLDEALNS